MKKTIAVFFVLIFVFVCFDMTPERLPTEDASVPRTESRQGTVSVAGKAVCMGEHLDTVLGSFGEAREVLVSEYGFYWYIFHDSYKNYIQIGFEEDCVVAVYTNAPDFTAYGIRPGMSRTEARQRLGEPVYQLVKGGILCQTMKPEAPAAEGDLFFTGDAYIRVFYDIFKHDSVTSVNIIAEETMLRLGLYGTPGAALAESFARQSYHVANALRVREGYRPLVWSDALAQAALGHSADMASHDYFAHEDREGNQAGERLHNAGISYRRAAENLAMGSQNSLIMHEMLMNSEGHRENLLGDFQFMGVGVSFRADGAPYLTQNFTVPPVAVIFG